MKQVLETAELNQQRAWDVIEKSGVIGIWESTGAKVNLVGSLKSKLLVKHRDIDFHIYSDPVTVQGSFAAMEKLAENPAIKRIEFGNLLDTEEACIEWHAWYEDDEKELWQLDMIHIQKGSAYDGYMEKVTGRIIEVLTPETRQAILRIKYDIPETEKVAGIEVYWAVLVGHARSYPEFVEWRKEHPLTGVLEWIP